MEFAWQHSGGAFFVAHLRVRHFLLLRDVRRYAMGLLDDDVLLNTYPFNLLAAINSAITT